MATQSWPTSEVFRPCQPFSIGVSTAESTYTGFYTGNREKTSHAADRLRCTLMLPPSIDRTAGGQREAFLMGLKSTGDFVTFGPLHRRVNLGTMTGSPTVSGAVLAGARSIVIQTTAGATMVGGDWISISNNLLQTGYAGATANGSGVMTMPLVFPVQKPIANASAIVVSGAVGVWELEDQEIQLDYSAGNLQSGVALPFRQVIV